MNNKKLYEQQIEGKLDEWIADIDKLKARAKQADAETRIAINQHIEDLQSQETTARKKLKALHQAGDDSWEDLKVGIADASQAMGNAVDLAVSRFK